jgi:hypothetical protein
MAEKNMSLERITKVFRLSIMTLSPVLPISAFRHDMTRQLDVEARLPDVVGQVRDGLMLLMGLGPKWMTIGVTTEPPGGIVTGSPSWATQEQSAIPPRISTGVPPSLWIVTLVR